MCLNLSLHIREEGCPEASVEEIEVVRGQDREDRMVGSCCDGQAGEGRENRSLGRVSWVELSLWKLRQNPDKSLGLDR